MKWWWVAALAAAFFVFVGGAVASSPWLVWFTLSASNGHSVSAEALAQADTSFPQHRLVIFSHALPSALREQATLDFTGLIDRWRYVATHQTVRAWRETALTLAGRPVPLWPAALLHTERWFDDPTLIIATRQGRTVRLLAQPADEALPRLVLPEAPVTPETISFTVPGPALGLLPTELQAAWNALVHEKLGFRATSPDIIGELSRHGRVFMNISATQASLGVVTASDEDRKRWVESIERWAADEDRFRRPIEQAFRLPDGSVGRERVAGLPGSIWTEEEQHGCRAPLPEKPALWVCTTDDHHVLATYPWRPLATVSTEWQIILGAEALKTWPGLTAVQAGGAGAAAAAVITTTSN